MKLGNVKMLETPEDARQIHTACLGCNVVLVGTSFVGTAESTFSNLPVLQVFQTQKHKRTEVDDVLSQLQTYCSGGFISSIAQSQTCLSFQAWKLHLI